MDIEAPTRGRLGPWLTLCCVVGLAIVATKPAGGEPTADNLIVRTSPVTGLATFVTARDGGAIAEPAVTAGAGEQSRAFFHQKGYLFGVADPDHELRLVRTVTDRFGQTHATYQQVHHGVPVFSGALKVHQSVTADVVAANGDFYPIPPEVHTTPTLSSDEAVAIAKGQIEKGEPVAERADLVIVDPGWYGDPPSGEHLAYYVVLSDLSVDVREAFFVDAHSGKVLDRWNLIHTARNRQIYDANFTPILPGGALIRSEGSPPVSSPVDADLAYDYAGDVYDYFSRAFGRDSIDDAGMTMTLTVRSTAISCPNAFWSGSQMVFCSGTVTDDITAHEIGHGITDFTADLIYQNQSGQLNEAYSDIWGELVDLFNGNAAFKGTPSGTPWPRDQWYLTPGLDTPNNARSTCSFDPGYSDGVRWLIGEDADSFGGAIRDMWDPPCYGDPDRANSPLQTCNPADNGGVHSGSGIPNHAFAIMTDGKWFNGQTVNGIGPIKAAAVWYRAVTVYLGPGADFKDAYYALNQAAQDLIGTTPLDPRTGNPSDSEFAAFDAAQVDEALLAVEMNTDGACGAAVPVLNSDPPDECSPHKRVFFEDFEDGAPGWTVLNEGRDPDDELPTPYDWELTDELPYERTGTAHFCADPDLGNCGSQDESGRHKLFSPWITLPAELDQPMVVFTHYMASETGYDGGVLRIRVDRNDGEDPPWYLISTFDFVYNPYNSRLRSAIQGNTNPMNDIPAWTGVGGQWGTTLADVSSYVLPSDQVQIVFDFGKDGCTGVDGWYVDNVGVYDCNGVDIVGSGPPSGAIDARRPHAPHQRAVHEGWDSVDIELSHPSGGLLDAFEVTEVGGDGTAPQITGITHDGAGIATLTLSEPIEPGAWTRIEHTPVGWSTCLGYLPADVDGGGQSTIADIDALINAINVLPGEVPPGYAADINRSGTVNAQDMLSLINLLNGAGDHATWISRTLPPNPCN